MGRQKRHRNRVYQLIGEPGPGALVVGYVRYSMELQDATSIVTQKRRIQEYADRKGWTIIRWYEEPEQSAKYEDIEKRPVFAQLLAEAGQVFQVVLCYMNNRWSRNVAVAYTSLSQLRRKQVWWATADGLWDIDKVQQDGFDVAFAVDTQMNAAYVRQLSKRTIDGKEDRARDGYHNGNVPFGYLPPEYPKAPNGAPSTWKPPRMPVRTDPINFPAIVQIGELVARGWSDPAIANELSAFVSQTPRFGTRALTKDTIAAIRRSWFPREFAPGCGHGTVETPSGELIEGRHPAAWPYALWQRMIQTKEAQFRRPRREALRKAHEFSRIAVCASCRRPLRVQNYPGGKVYYRDTSAIRKLPCASFGYLSVKNTVITHQFGELLASVRLPESWRDAIADHCSQANQHDDQAHLRQRRAELEAEQKRLVTAFAKGYLTEEDLDTQMERVRGELFALPVPARRNVDECIELAISAGETLTDMSAYWAEATAEERRDILWALLNAEGLLYDLERWAIVGVYPRADVLPVLTVGLDAERWEQRGEVLWLRETYLPPKRDRPPVNHPPLTERKLNAEQAAEAIALVRSGKTLREVGRIFDVSYGAIWRLMHAEKMKGDEAIEEGETP